MSDEKNKTNRVAMNDLSDKHLAQLILHDIPRYMGGYTNSLMGLEEWLSKDYDSDCWIWNSVKKGD